MKSVRKIELLAPARNLECGLAAIDHGADAVYIGAPRFGARSAAGNSLEDIAELVKYAHLYNARIYVTVNTILRDEELKDTEEMIWQLYHAGVDALIVQDMAILRMNLPPIPLHASTQTDNRTPEQVKFLADGCCPAPSGASRRPTPRRTSSTKRASPWSASPPAAASTRS